MVDMETLHSPYDGSAKPFGIGLARLDPATWIDVDHHFERYIQEKHRLTRERFDDVFVAEPGTEAAQQEVAELISAHLRDHCAPDNSAGQSATPAGPDGKTLPVLHQAAFQVQEDLVLMRKGEAGWRLAAASVCFPSSWTLSEKFGRVMEDIHAPVPGFSSGTRNAALITRIFDNLQVDMPVLRWNWSVYGDDRLFHPQSNDSSEGKFGPGPIARNIYLRLERQTLRRLHQSGDILFTIRIYNDPLERLETHPDGARLASAIADQVKTLSPAERAYKGLATEQQRLLDRLAMIEQNQTG